MIQHWRLSTIALSFTVAGLMILVKLAEIQVAGPDRDYLLRQSDLYSGTWITVYPSRGHIYDRWGNLLAGNVAVYQIGLDLQAVTDPAGIAYAVSLITGDEYDRVYRIASQDPSPEVRFPIVTDYVPYDQVQQLDNLRRTLASLENRSEKQPIKSLHGLIFTPHLTRSYPEGDLGSNVLGFFSRNGQGYFGVEEQYDELLSGKPTRVWVPEDPYLVEDLPDIPPGADIVLTIDREIQEMVEDILDNAVTRNGAEAGTIIVLDPRTGEILSMATFPRIDPNEYWESGEMISGTTPFNPAVSNAYEPGSVYKILTMAAALDDGAVDLDTIFRDEGRIEVGGAVIRNWNLGAWGEQDMLGCLQHSLNVCLAWIATRLGPGTFYDYMSDFGLGHATGVDLAGEVPGRLKLPGDWDWYPADLATNSFGQGVSVTPLQMAIAAAALANDGEIMAPRILRSLVNNGHQYNPPPQLIATPIEAETARTITMLLAASLENEASTALVPGYRLAGKTGTAEIPTPFGYTSNVTNVSFVGWGPVDDPQFVVYVWLEKPTSSIWGSIVAAPIFSAVVERLVLLMNIPPDDIRLGAAAP
ncbi:MAG TPA: penicillin-binding protein 2 [Anaerolineales bacterium]|nr:penicillin-binding protein 2 [Anaerolineales bacterium]